MPLLSDGDGSIQSESRRIANYIEKSAEPVILVAQGSALPAVMAAATLTKPAGIVLTNGVLGRIDPMTRALCGAAQMPHLVFDQMSSPQFVLRWLRSSAGLRRTVVNPYVMDHDTTVAICGPTFKDKAKRKRLQRYLKDLLVEAKKDPEFPVKTLLCWGDKDPLNSVGNYPFSLSDTDLVTKDVIPGGKYLHPVERPWEIADRIQTWAANNLTTT
ncbi:MAG: hypothetical protein ACPGTU_06145 [Myxococcota bacterium]